MPSIYIVNPRNDFPSYHSAEAFTGADGTGWVQVADLTTTTVAALVPEGWDIRLTDEAISEVDLDAEVDFVALTAKVSQRSRLIELAAEFRARGRVVVIGGSFASLTADDVRPHADILVTGELEELAPRLFADLAAGQWADHYDGGQADLGDTPIPRWDLYPVDRAQSGALQTSRGCPFSCEFCDVIAYQGRKQRFKPIPKVIAELDALHDAGFRRVFLVDDNLTVNRRRARALLAAIAEWNATRADDPVSFLAQGSMDVARDAELLDACVAAGVTMLFMGIETMNEASLLETGKKQNLLQPIDQAVATILARGIAVVAGVIVGFDADDRDIFARQFDFFQGAPLPDLTIAPLVAPRATALYARMQAEGRLSGEAWDASASNFFATNIEPALMTRRELLDGVRWLVETAYAPENFERRMMNFIAAFGDQEAPRRGRRGGGVSRLAAMQAALRMLTQRGPRDEAAVSRILQAASRKPAAMGATVFFLSRYAQVRHCLDRYRAELA